MQPVLAILLNLQYYFTFGYLTKGEIDILHNAPDRTCWRSCRNYVMLLLLYNTGARLQDLVKLLVKDVYPARQKAIHFFGKNRKERIVPM
nr:tyrosine-type recombinase/integrase [uncultured Glaciecola sp.]